MMNNTKLRTDKNYNLDIVNIDDCGEFMPIIAPCLYIPENLIGFNQCMSNATQKDGIHFFIDDYQFERLWRKPDRYIETLSMFPCVLTPDFSLYNDMPFPMQQWNIYRSRALGNYWQRIGMNVIPTLSWSTKESYNFAFDGLPKKSTYAVSTVGVKKDKKAIDLWKNGMEAFIEKLEPNTILLYGSDIDFDFCCNIKKYKNKTLERLRHGR